MELNGEEKRIQALFHEMKAQDEELAPPFARTWNMVEAKLARPVRLNRIVTFPRLLMVIFILGFLITAVVVWSHRSPRQQAQDSLASQAPENPVRAFEPETKPTSETGGSRELKSQKLNKSIAVVHRFTGKKVTARSNSRQLRKIELSQWQSPTAGLLRFPGDELLKNSPALNQFAHEMRGFLSNLN